MRGYPTILAAAAAFGASLGCWLLGAGPAHASAHPLTAAVGVYKLGDSAGTGTTGLPLALAVAAHDAPSATDATQFRAATPAEIQWARDHFNPPPPFFASQCRTHRVIRSSFECNGRAYLVQSRHGQSLFPPEVR